MGEKDQTPPPQQESPGPGRGGAQLEYRSDGPSETKGTVGSKVILVLVWGLGLVSWGVWVGILIYLFVRFIA